MPDARNIGLCESICMSACIIYSALTTGTSLAYTHIYIYIYLYTHRNIHIHIYIYRYIYILYLGVGWGCYPILRAGPSPQENMFNTGLGQ